MISKVGTCCTVLTSIARLSLFNIHVTGVKIQPGIKLRHPVPKTTYHSAGKLAIQFTNLHSCILILCRKVVIYEQYEKNWIQIIGGSQTKHMKLWRLSKTKPCLGGDVRSIKIQCHNYPVCFSPKSPGARAGAAAQPLRAAWRGDGWGQQPMALPGHCLLTGNLQLPSN